MLNAEQQSLVEEHVTFLHRVIHRFRRTKSARADIDEMTGNGSLALCEAVRRHLPERASLKTYAGKCITMAVTEGMRRERQAPRGAKRDVVVSEAECRRPDGSAIELDEYVSASEPAPEEQVQAREILERLLGRLSERERIVIELMFLARLSGRDVAKRLGLAASTVYGIRARALRKMRMAARVAA